jgi:hypothetical protein
MNSQWKGNYFTGIKTLAGCFNVALPHMLAHCCLARSAGGNNLTAVRRTPRALIVVVVDVDDDAT